MEGFPKILFLLILSLNIDLNSAENELVPFLGEKLQSKFSESTNYVAKWLEDFNDNHLGRSEFGKMLKYDVLKAKFGTTTSEGRGMKKMSMALIPLIFHVGATSTWMILTSIMAVKSVAIGLILLIFKIAVSSAKVASFFTALKTSHGHHHEYSWTPPSHYEHHGHVRSLNDVDLGSTGYPSSWDPYTQYVPSGQDTSSSYKTVPSNEGPYSQPEYKTDIKKGPIAS